MYFGNVEPATVVLHLQLFWVGEAPSPFSLETRSTPIAAHSVCERALPLSPDTLIPASSERGGTYESWECNRLPESHFYEAIVPPQSVMIALPGSQYLNAHPCGCEPLLEDLLVNLEATPRVIQLEATPSEPLGMRIAALPPNATCEGATPLALDGAEQALVPFPRLVSGVDECAHNDVHYFVVEVPPRSTVEVSARLNTPYPTLALAAACGDACTRSEVALPDGTRILTWSNENDAPITRWILVGSDGPAEGPLEGTVRARLAP